MKKLIAQCALLIIASCNLAYPSSEATTTKPSELRKLSNGIDSHGNDIKKKQSVSAASNNHMGPLKNHDIGWSTHESSIKMIKFIKSAASHPDYLDFPGQRGELRKPSS